MFCPRCGAQVPDGAGFCVRCGLPLFQAQNGQPPGGALVPTSGPNAYNQPVLKLGPGGHWYLNGMPLMPATGDPAQPTFTPALIPEHVVEKERPVESDAEYSPEAEKKSDTLDYLSKQWVEPEKESDEWEMPVQGMVSDKFDRYRPDIGGPVELPVEPNPAAEKPEPGIGSNRLNPEANYGADSVHREGLAQDPTFSKFRDREADRREASVPYYLPRLIFGAAALAAAALLTVICIRQNTFRMLWRMTFDGMYGKALLILIPLLVAGGIFGIISRTTEGYAVASASCYLAVVVTSYLSTGTYPFLLFYLFVFGAGAFADILYFFVKDARS